VSTNDLIAAGTIAGAVFLGFAAYFTWLELRRGARARETGLLLELAFRWTEREMTESMTANSAATRSSLRSLIEKKTLSASERDDWLRLQRVPNFLEAVGYLERNRSAIHVRDAEGFWGSQIIDLWKLWEPTVYEVLRPKSDTALLNFESLSKKVIRYRARRLRREEIRNLLRAALPGLPKR
jgi:hypothetical protein